MKPSFNVLDQGWIPVSCVDGSRQLLGIRQILSDAHELREISDPSPLDEYSMYRFLGLFLMDALRPKDEEEIEDLLEEGQFDMTKIEQYIAQCQAEGVSFDLFDEDRPFLQSRFDQNQTDKIKPVSKLDCTIPRETSHTHFDHRSINKIHFPPDKALRALLSSYIFCVADGRGYYYSVYGAPPYFGVIKGANLFESLIATLLPLDQIGPDFDNPPVFWRNRTPVIPERRIGKVSWLQGMLFPARTIQLIPDECGTVSKVFFFSGEKFDNPSSWRDPYVTLQERKKDVFPLLPMKNDTLWRNLCDVVDIPNNHASPLVQLYNSLHKQGLMQITLYGVRAKNGQATYYSVCRHDFSLPNVLIQEPSTADLLNIIITFAERIRSALMFAYEIPNEKDENLSEEESFFDSESFDWRTNKQNKKSKDIKYWAPSYIREKVSAQYEQFCQEKLFELCNAYVDPITFQGDCISFIQAVSGYTLKLYEESFKGISIFARTQAMIVQRQESLKDKLVRLAVSC